MKISLTREDILSSKVLPPGWYLCRIKDVTTEPSKGDNSTNYIFQFVVSDGQFKDTSLKKWYANEKYMGVLTELLSVLLGREVTPEDNIDLESTKGKNIRIKVKNTEWNGRMGNEAEGFKAV